MRRAAATPFRCQVSHDTPDSDDTTIGDLLLPVPSSAGDHFVELGLISNRKLVVVELVRGEAKLA